MALRVTETKLVRLTREVDAFIARELATQMAETAGFDGYQSADIEIAVSEIGSNALRYGERGWAALTVGPQGFSASITDEGPGFDVWPATKAGLGVGLDGARRLMDDLIIERMPGGSRVTIKKELKGADLSGETRDHWELAVVTRLKKGNSTSGDMWWSRRHGDSVMVAVVDGLGSGPPAAQASRAALDAMAEGDPTTPLDRILGAAHEAARSTRGAVGMVVRVDGPSLEYCGVGDVSGRIEPAGDTLLASPGILGVDIGEPSVRRLSWSEDTRLALWTDGLDMPVAVVASLGAGLPGEVLETLAHQYGTDRDDGLFLHLRAVGGSAP